MSGAPQKRLGNDLGDAAGDALRKPTSVENYSLFLILPWYQPNDSLLPLSTALGLLAVVPLLLLLPPA
jgi:hypothetical protein